MTHKFFSTVLFLAAGLLLYFFGEAVIGLVKGSVNVAHLTVPARIGIVLATIVIACFLLYLAIKLITDIFFPHLNITDPLEDEGIEDAHFNIAEAARAEPSIASETVVVVEQMRPYYETHPDAIPSQMVVISNLRSPDPKEREHGASVAAAAKVKAARALEYAT